MMQSLNGIFIAILLIILLCSCAQRVVRPAADSYKLKVADNSEARRFDVSLESGNTRALCISIENWPNQSGYFTIEKGDTFVQVGTNRFLAKSGLMSAYCPGGCGEHRIEPNGSLRGFISYEAFDNSEKLSTESKKHLNFPVTPYYCH